MAGLSVSNFNFEYSIAEIAKCNVTATTSTHPVGCNEPNSSSSDCAYPTDDCQTEFGSPGDSIAHNVPNSSSPCDYASVTKDKHNSPAIQSCQSEADGFGDSLVSNAPNSSLPSGGVTNCAFVTEIGDQDLELLEMRIYDSYRQEDGAPHSYEYLLDCRKNIMRKLHSCKKEVNDLQKEKLEAQVKHREEIKRIRQFYEVIAFAKSRSGKIVRSAMGTSAAAVEVIRDMNSMFNDS